MVEKVTSLTPMEYEHWKETALLEGDIIDRFAATIDDLYCVSAQLLGALEWRRDMLIEILEKSVPAGEGWYKVPPGVLTRLGEIEELARPAIELAKK